MERVKILSKHIHFVDLPCVFRGLGRVKKEDVNDPVCQVKVIHAAADGIADAFGVDGITDRLIMVSHDPLVKQGCCTAAYGIHHGRDVVREGQLTE